MKLKALSLALVALPITSFATEPVSHQPTDVSFSVEAEKEVERDLLQVSLFYQAEGNDLSALNKTMAEKMNKAIDLAKAQSAVEIKDNSRNTWIRYDNKGKQQGCCHQTMLYFHNVEIYFSQYKVKLHRPSPGDNNNETYH